MHIDHAVRDTSADFAESLCVEYQKHNQIDPAFYEHYYVKRSSRSADGTGIMAGVTQISNVMGYYVQDGERIPTPGKLVYRDIDVEELINGFVSEGRFGFEEIAYLLLFGALPTRAQLTTFEGLFPAHRALPPMFIEDMTLKTPNPDVMNKLARSMLALRSYDGWLDDISLLNQLRQAVEFVARVSVIVAHILAAKRHYCDNESLYLHRPQEGLSVAQDFLYSIHHDSRYIDEEARLPGLCLVLHTEHGGGDNSTSACWVLSSSDTDIYSSIATAVDPLKDPHHGGVDKKITEMFGHIETEMSDWTDDNTMWNYLGRPLRKGAGDRSGLTYGMGHIIYTLSDPRAVLLKRFARSLTKTKGMLDEFELSEWVEHLTPEVLRIIGEKEEVIRANVDLFSGLVYKMMGILMEFYTPLFAVAQVVGRYTHRTEEVCQPANRIIHPACRAMAPMHAFVSLGQG